MRVLLALYRDTPRTGGSWRVGQTLARAFKAQGMDAHVCFAYGPPGPVGLDQGDRAHYLGLSGSRDFTRWPRYRGLLQHLEPDIVHYVDAVFWMHAAALGSKFKEVVHVHTTFWEPQRTLDMLAWRFLRMQADAFVCISEGARDATVRLGLASPEQATVVYNAIDFDSYQQRPDRAAARQALALPPDAQIVGMPCRVVKWKGCDDLIRSLPFIPDWQALIVGDGPDRARIEQLAETLGVRQRVWFVDNMDDVRTAYAAMDAFAMLSVNEPFGLVIAEAMASRVPVFGLVGGGEYREPAWPLVTPDNAVFVSRKLRHTTDDEEDPAVLRQFAAGLAAFGRDRDAYRPMIDRAWSHVRERFSMDVQARAMVAVYERILEPGAKSA